MYAARIVPNGPLKMSHNSFMALTTSSSLQSPSVWHVIIGQHRLALGALAHCIDWQRITLVNRWWFMRIRRRVNIFKVACSLFWEWVCGWRDQAELTSTIDGFHCSGALRKKWLRHLCTSPKRVPKSKTHIAHEIAINTEFHLRCRWLPTIRHLIANIFRSNRRSREWNLF